MLIKAKSIRGFKLFANDGEIGKIDEFFFDDHHYTVRYLVVDTGNWLTHNEVLISPYAVLSVNKDEEYVSIDLSKRQIEDSPGWDSDKPVSRQFETSFHDYYGYPVYWAGSMMWGPYPFISRNREDWNKADKNERHLDAHLHSTKDVTGHSIQAFDGEIGHVDDFIIDNETWAIRYLVVDTHKWWPGRRVLISTQWIDHVSWNESKVYVNLSLERIKLAPEYSEKVLLDRDYENTLHRYYDREGYWSQETAEKDHSL
ncbi:MAG TPA: PRC-barrel domain-containing protein [Prolixibacteraceae bacterium]